MRRSRLIAGATLLTVLVAGCQQPPPATDLDRILGAGTIRVCSTGDYPPFSFRDSGGRWSGLDVDLAGDLATRLGVALAWVPTTWSSLLNDLDASCDLAMGGITITLDRAKRARFSAPYLRDGKAAAVRCVDATRFRSLADLDQPGVRVVVNPGGTNAAFDAATLKRATIVEYPDNTTIFGQLTGGQADAMITDASEVSWQTERDPALCGVGVDHPFSFAQKAYLIRCTDPMTQQWVDQWLGIIAHDGTYAGLSQKWLGRVVGP